MEPWSGLYLSQPQCGGRFPAPCSVDAGVAGVLTGTAVIDEIKVAVLEFGDRCRMLVLSGNLRPEDALGNDFRIGRRTDHDKQREARCVEHGVAPWSGQRVENGSEDCHHSTNNSSPMTHYVGRPFQTDLVAWLDSLGYTATWKRRPTKEAVQ